MKENNKCYLIKITKSGVLFYTKTNYKLFEDFKAEYFLDFKHNLNLKQFKMGFSK